MKNQSCPLCGKLFSAGSDGSHKMTELVDKASVNCIRGGSFEISFEAWSNLKSRGPFPRLSHRARLAHELGTKWLIDAQSAEKEACRSALPVASKQRLLIEHLGRASRRPGDEILLNDAWPVADCDDQDELGWHLVWLESRRLVERDRADGRHCAQLTAEGWGTVENRSSELVEPDLAFVAMWFDPDLDAAWAEGFQPGITSAGYRAERSGSVASTEPIDRKLIGDIRRSRFVVADATGHRPNVYFEAGYALALDKPVIWTVREDHKDDLHFDTRQFPHLIWKDPEDLAAQLEDFVAGTVGRLGSQDSV